MKPASQPQPKPDEVDLVQLALQESLAMVDRFSAEPVFGPTGKGFLKSEGVAELERLKRATPNQR